MLRTHARSSRGPALLRWATASLLASVAITVVATASAQAQGAPVKLDALYNVNAAYSDGKTFTGGGLDGLGDAYSANALGTTAVVNGTTLNLGTKDQLNGVSNQTIPVKAGKYAGFVMLAAGINGSYPSQTFAVTYTDGTRAQFVQGVSDWFAPQSYTGEMRTITMPYRNTSNGGRDNRTFYAYGYAFPLDGTRTVQSIVLPSNPNVVVLALSFVTAVPASLVPSFNRAGVYPDGAVFSPSGGLDARGRAYSGALLGTYKNVGGIPYVIGGAGIPNVVSAGSQTITLPPMQGTAIKVLAAAVNGNQVSQPFTVTYKDGTRTTFTQSLSDWVAPASFAGETRALTMAYRNTNTGARETRTTYLYGYSFTLNTTKTVATLQLPNNPNVEVVAVTVAPVASNDSGILGSCGTARKGSSSDQSPVFVDYALVYSSPTSRWCVDRDYWLRPGVGASISQFFTYGEASLQRLKSLFQQSPPSPPFTFQAWDVTGGASTGSDFGEGVRVTGDAFVNVAADQVSGQPLPGFWGFLLTLHEAINDFTGYVTAGWPHDWWADHRSPFPNSMDGIIMADVGATLNNANLVAAAKEQRQRFSVAGLSGYDSQVAMFDGFFTQYGGFNAYQSTFVLLKGDGINLDSVAPWVNSSRNWKLLAEYVIAYLQMGFRTTADLTQSKFIASGVGTKDTTIAPYTPDASIVRAVGNAHCGIRAAQTAGVDVSAPLSALRRGDYANAKANGGTQTTCPAECKWSTTVSRCVVRW